MCSEPKCGCSICRILRAMIKIIKLTLPADVKLAALLMMVKELFQSGRHDRNNGKPQLLPGYPRRKKDISSFLAEE